MLSEEQKQGIGMALNEGILLGAEIDVGNRIAVATVAVLTLPENGPMPNDRRVQLRMQPVGRVIASLRLGRWDDKRAKVKRFKHDQLLDVVTSFGGQPIYGWEFIDAHNQTMDVIGKRVSMKIDFESDGKSHTITFFQGNQKRHLDLIIWFDDLIIFSPDHEQIPVEEFIAGGRRWWEALNAGDERVSGMGIIPFSKSGSSN